MYVPRQDRPVNELSNPPSAADGHGPLGSHVTVDSKGKTIVRASETILLRFPYVSFLYPYFQQPNIMRPLF